MAVRNGAGFTVYRAEKVAVYVSADFVKLLEGSSSEPSADVCPTDMGVLFERGVLTGEMFVAAAGEAAGESPVQHYFPRDTDSVDDALARDPGPLMKLLNCMEVPSDAPTGRRRYDLWVTFDPRETGWGSFHHFTVVLQGSQPAPASTLRGYLRAARLVSFEYNGMEI